MSCHPERSARNEFPTRFFSGSPTSAAFALVGVIVAGRAGAQSKDLRFLVALANRRSLDSAALRSG